MYIAITSLSCRKHEDDMSRRECERHEYRHKKRKSQVMYPVELREDFDVWISMFAFGNHICVRSAHAYLTTMDSGVAATFRELCRSSLKDTTKTLVLNVPPRELGQQVGADALHKSPWKAIVWPSSAWLYCNSILLNPHSAHNLVGLHLQSFSNIGLRLYSMLCLCMECHVKH